VAAVGKAVRRVAPSPVAVGCCRPEVGCAVEDLDLCDGIARTLGARRDRDRVGRFVGQARGGLEQHAPILTSRSWSRGSGVCSRHIRGVTSRAPRGASLLARRRGCATTQSKMSLMHKKPMTRACVHAYKIRSTLRQ
jgi:hypothetical protein